MRQQSPTPPPTVPTEERDNQTENLFVVVLCLLVFVLHLFTVILYPLVALLSLFEVVLRVFVLFLRLFKAVLCLSVVAVGHFVAG